MSEKIYGIPVTTPLNPEKCVPNGYATEEYVNQKIQEIGQGGAGGTGTTFIPAVDADGNLSWSNNGGLENPETVNIKGPKGDTGPIGGTGPQGNTGATGKDGTTPHIGSNGNWWIGDTDTGVSAGGSGGSSSVYILAEGEDISNAPADAVLVIDPGDVLTDAEGCGF